MRGFHGSMSGWRRAIGAALRDAGRLVLAGWLSTLTSLGPLPAAAAGQPEAPAAGPTLVFLPLVASQSMSTSKMPTLLEGRAAAVLAALGDAGPGGALSAQTVADLSDYLLHVSPAGELLVEFHARGAVGASEKAELAARGARVVSSTGDLRWPAGVSAPAGLGVIAAWVPAAQVADLARLAWVAAVRPAEHTPADVGGSLSEGVALHNADDVQTAGVDGAGVSVGVISDGVSNLAAAQGSNDLPAGVTVLSTGSGDEGTAMLEIVHDMAPGAALVFAATGGGVANHIAAQTALVAAGVDLIAEDIPFDGEPVFQKGSAAVSGDNIAGAGVGMHSSAGNLGQSHAARVVAAGTGAGPDGFNGPFTGCAVNPANAVAIAPGGDTTFDVMLGNSTSFTLQWSEPRAIFPTAGAGGFTNLDLFLMNAAGTTCLAQSTAVQGNGAGDTIEQLTTGAGLNGTAAKIVVSVTGVNGAAAAPTLDLRWRGASATDAATQAGSLNPDSNYTGLATAAGAVNAGASTNPAAVGLEGFSGGGPVQLFSTTVCPGAYPCPGAAVAGPAVVTAGAPAWAAADGVDVSGAGGFSDPFFGTSAAAPSAAGCEALVREHLGAGATVAAVNARLAATATDRGPAGVDNLWGAGVLDCRRAILPTAHIGGPYN
nr:hypothetical protein [Anaerolineales bacterium]